MDRQTLVARANHIRFTHRDIARATALNPNTVGRTLAGDTDPRSSTLEKIAKAIEAEELKLLHHLVDLHGIAKAAA